MTVREILSIGHPVLREQARELTADELASPAAQALKAGRRRNVCPEATVPS